VIQTLYIEEAITTHPRTRTVCARFPHARHISCSRYSEVFNRKAQNFRLQKKQPALILAEKFAHRVLPAPSAHGIAGEHNYYFSHMMNCLYDCRYCFLQGRYRSAHYVLFINYEDFLHEIESVLDRHRGAPVYFFSGYDCDSLALDPVTGFSDFFLPWFRRHPHAYIELRTKSTQIRSLLEMEAFDNCVIAFSFTPAEISQALEHRVPTLERRLNAMAKLQDQGWPVGLRFDPLIYQDGYAQQYRRLFEQIFARIDATRIHSVSLGNFRLPEVYYNNIYRMYPDEKLFSGQLLEENGMVSYRQELAQEMMAACNKMLEQYISNEILYPCMPGGRHRLAANER